MAQEFPKDQKILTPVMRALFASERRSVSTLFQLKWKRQIQPIPVVLTETIAEPSNPKKKPWFNCDFILHFVDWRSFKSERAASCCSVLPNALGAELFLVVEKETLMPTALELNGGGAFAIKDYAKYIEIVEPAIREELNGLQNRLGSYLSARSSQATSITKAAFARLMVVGSDVTFLYCPNDTSPAMRGQRISLAQGDDREIDCYLDGEDIVCIDGWIRTNVIRSEVVLVGVPDDV